MTERQWTQKLTAMIKRDRMDMYWHKLGDTYGGHKKPCDVIFARQGHTFFLEIKDGDKPLTANEIEHAIKYSMAGGTYYILRYYPDKTLRLSIYGRDEQPYTYTDIKDFILWL